MGRDVVKIIDFFKGKRVFITGHSGFKGSWLCHILKYAGSEITGFSLEPYSSPNLFETAEVATGIHSIIGDITDFDVLKKAFDDASPDYVIHLAAQPLVKTSYKDPLSTYRTNVMGTVNILECIRINGNVKSFLNVTTDKVYLNKEWAWGYRENDELNGHDPYSNSKSCSELVTSSYKKSFFFDTDRTCISTVRSGNVIGGGDFSEHRIIPDCFRAAIDGRDIIIRNPHSIRPYQHVLESLFAYLAVLKGQVENHGLAGSYNIGPLFSDCITTGKIAELFCASWGSGQNYIIQPETGAPHEADFLRLDTSLIYDMFGIKPKWDISTAISNTVEWYKIFISGGDIKGCMDNQIRRYIK
jgi:CDP-glucose 4,6-dehydratase